MSISHSPEHMLLCPKRPHSDRHTPQSALGGDGGIAGGGSGGAAGVHVATRSSISITPATPPARSSIATFATWTSSMGGVRISNSRHNAPGTQRAAASVALSVVASGVGAAPAYSTAAITGVGSGARSCIADARSHADTRREDGRPLGTRRPDARTRVAAESAPSARGT